MVPPTEHMMRVGSSQEIPSVWFWLAEGKGTYRLLPNLLAKALIPILRLRDGTSSVPELEVQPSMESISP